MFAEEIRRAVEAAPRARLPEVAALLWRAYGEGRVTEAEAGALSASIDARLMRVTDRAGPTRNGCGRDANGAPDAFDAPQDRRSRPRRPGVGSRPRTDASMERRRRWAASGRLPPGIAARFTLAEQAVLALIAAEHARRKDCRLAVGHLAAIAGVSETTVRNAVREARKLGLVTVEERQVTGFRNDTNVVRVVSPEWLAWLRLARRSPVTGGGLSLDREQKGGGCKSPNRTPTAILHPVDSGPRKPRRAAGGQNRGGGGARSGHG